MKEIKVGRVIHYFTNLGVAAIDLTDESLSTGETIHIKGHTTDFIQKVESIQIEKQKVEMAERGKSIGIKVKEHARENDIVYRVIEE